MGFSDPWEVLPSGSAEAQHGQCSGRVFPSSSVADPAFLISVCHGYLSLSTFRRALWVKNSNLNFEVFF